MKCAKVVNIKLFCGWLHIKAAYTVCVWCRFKTLSESGVYTLSHHCLQTFLSLFLHRLVSLQSHQSDPDFFLERVGLVFLACTSLSCFHPPGWCFTMGSCACWAPFDLLPHPATLSLPQLSGKLPLCQPNKYKNKLRQVRSMQRGLELLM